MGCFVGCLSGIDCWKGRVGCSSGVGESYADALRGAISELLGRRKRSA